MDTETMKRILRSHLTEVDARFGTHTVIPEDSIDEICEELVAALAELSKPPDHATRYGHCSGCKTGGTHYLGSIEHPDPDEHLPDDQYLAKKQERFALNPQSDEDPAPVLVAFSEEQLRTEITHIFDSGVNEIRIFDMVKMFIERNTRAVSVDQLVGVVTNVLDGMDNSTSFIYVDDLREAFAKLVGRSRCFCERELGTTKDGNCLAGCYHNGK